MIFDHMAISSEARDFWNVQRLSREGVEPSGSKRGAQHQKLMLMMI